MKIIVVGAGEVGFHIASRLSLENKDVVVIDNDSNALRSVEESLDVQTVLGSGSSPKVLKEAGLMDAEFILAVTNSDEINIVACLVADIECSSIQKLARIRNIAFDDYDAKLNNYAPHIKTVINPEIELVKNISHLISIPGASDASEFADGRISFLGVRLEKAAQVEGRRLFSLPAILKKPIPLIVAIMREDDLIIPRGDDRLLAGDTIYFVSEKKNLHQNLTVFEKKLEPVSNVIIVGGGNIGLRLAMMLEQQSIYVKIIERDLERCKFLASCLNKTIVIQGDGSDRKLLVEENIQDVDVAVMVTNDEQTNILASLLAKRLGATKAITKINRFDYLSLMNNIGIEKVVSPRLSTINSILKHIRKGHVISAISMRGEQAETIEAEAKINSGIVGKPIKDIALPRGMLVTGIIHDNETIIPSGNSIIHAGDRIIIFTQRKLISQLEKILAVKPDLHLPQKVYP